MQAMQTKLYDNINNDSANTKFHVLSVSFYEEKNTYLCQFTVRLQQKNLDTTGIMTAVISKDMKQVVRKS